MNKLMNDSGGFLRVKYENTPLRSFLFKRAAQLLQFFINKEKIMCSSKFIQALTILQERGLQGLYHFASLVSDTYLKIFKTHSLPN